MRYLLAFMAMMPFIAAAQLPDYVPTSGLAAWFDFRQGIEDLSPNQVSLQLNGGAIHTGESIVTNGASSWAETENLITNFQGDPEFTVIIVARRTGNFSFGSPWGLGGGIDVPGQQRTNINSWCNNFTNGIQLDLWGSHTLTTGQTYSSENFQAVVWRKSGFGFSNQSISISLDGSNSIALSQQRGSGTGIPTLPDTSRFFLGKAGLANNYYAPMEFRAAGLFDRPLTDEEVDVLISNLLTEGCTDPNACNFNENALLDDGSCVSCEVLAQACGEGTVWDSATSTCVPAVLSGDIAEDCTIMNLQELAQNHLLLVDQLATADSLLAICNGTADAETNAPWTCGDPLTYWDYDYATALIGDQCWFAEDLGLIDGAIPITTNENASEPAVYSDPSLNPSLHHYNHFAVTDWDLCPTGWRIPSASDWQTGIEAVQSGGTSPFDASGWNISLNGYWDSGNLELGQQATLWTSELDEDPTSSTFGWGLFQNFLAGGNQYTGFSGRNAGATIRCIKD